VRAFVVRRALLGLVVLLGVTIVTFMIARVIPSEPAARWVGPKATAEQIARARIELGLDRPLHVQYYRYMSDLLRGDWGMSIRTHQPVMEDIKAFLPASLELCVVGMAISLVIGIPLGVASAVRKDSWFDHANRTFAIAGVSMPTFWLGMILQLVFFKELGILPLGGRISSQMRWIAPFPRITGAYLLDTLLSANMVAFKDAFLHIILPALTLAAYPVGLVMRMTRSSMLEVMGEDYIRVAKAYGLPHSLVIYRYALKNAIGPTITVVALSFAYSLAGTFLIEAVFSWPGLGYYAALSVITVDYPAIMGVTILIAAFYVILNTLVDIVHAVLDPRIKIG